MSNDKKKDSVIALTPAEQGELAVIEEKYRKLAEDTKVEYLAGLKFKKKLEDPEIRVAARKAAIAGPARSRCGAGPQGSGNPHRQSRAAGPPERRSAGSLFRQRQNAR